jgi:hypothetical protein
MDENKNSPSIRSKLVELNVEFFPVTDTSITAMQEIKEIHRLVAQIILTGKKRGRPFKKELENEYVL